MGINPTRYQITTIAQHYCLKPSKLRWQSTYGHKRHTSRGTFSSSNLFGISQAFPNPEALQSMRGSNIVRATHRMDAKRRPRHKSLTCTHGCEYMYCSYRHWKVGSGTRRERDNEALQGIITTPRAAIIAKRFAPTLAVRSNPD